MVLLLWFGVCMDVGLVVRFAPLAMGPYKKNQDGAVIFAGKDAVQVPTCRPLMFDVDNHEHDLNQY
jgi:hypothetical protein